MPTIAHVPLILIRGFGGLGVEDERRVAYQGFADGTVYPGRRGENYIYEGLILKYLKSEWRYHDATNVIGYFSEPVAGYGTLPPVLQQLDQRYFEGQRIAIDPGTALQLKAGMERAGYGHRIDMASSRVGSIPGTHTVGFDGPADTITLTHTVRDRAVFARGALQAARWLIGKRGWFTMRDMLSTSEQKS